MGVDGGHKLLQTRLENIAREKRYCWPASALESESRTVFLMPFCKYWSNLHTVSEKKCLSFPQKTIVDNYFIA